MYIMFAGVLLVFILFGLTLYNFIKRNPLIKKIKAIDDIFIKFLVILLIITLITILIRENSFFFLGVIHFLMFSVIIDIIYFILNKFLSTRKIKPYKNIYNLGIVPIILTIIAISYGIWNFSNIIETNYTIYSEKELSKDYKVLFISDLHYGVNMDIKKLNEYKEMFNKENFDFVILGGDIVDEKTTNIEMKNVFSTLGSIKSKHGVFFVYGNHDKSNYRMGLREYTKEELERTIDNSNIISLVDDIYTINNELTLIGRNDASFTRDSGRKSSSELLEDIDKNDFLLMLDHQPIDLKKNKELGYDLQLSGHTHGGQIFPIGLMDNIFKVNEMNYGYKNMDNFSIIVSSGMAGWSYSFRTEKHSEYVIINIKNK